MSRLKALVGFAGFGGVDIALRNFGFEVLGIEIDPAIAEVNRFNGGDVITADILTMDPTEFIGYFLMHFSPPCPNFSIANQASSETELDIALAQKIARFIVVSQPQYFTLENVWLYRKSQSWSIILEALQGMGYGVDWWHLNAADYGVPQTRKRMIVVGRRDGQRPVKPWPTHAKTPDMFTKLWRGWFRTIEDLIPTLPDSQFADWQLDRAPEEWKTFLITTGNTSRNGSGNRLGRGVLEVDCPANTVTAGPKGGAMPRAFIMDSGNCGANNGNGTIRTEDEPIFTVTTGQKTAPIKALVFGRVVSMTTRALARFQTFPDSFVLPGEPGLVDNPILLSNFRSARELARHGIGNAVPPTLYNAVPESLGL